MTAPNIGGLGSGVQWNDIIDSTMKAMEARSVKPISDRITLRGKQRDAWTALQKLVETLNSNALAVRRSGIGGYTATVPPSPSTARTLVTATSTSAATPGRYRVEVVQLADVAKLSGRTVADTAAARGTAGSFSINGTTIAVAATDSLDTIRSTINSANAGVTASIVSEGGSSGRLVITANSAGSAGAAIVDGTGGMARDLGFLDTRSKPISSTTMAAAAAMGLAVTPQPASIRVGGTLITADLSVESISAIAAKIRSAGVAASVESEAFGNTTRHRLVVDGNVTAVDGDVNSQAVIDALGFAAGTAGLVAQTVQSAVFTDAGDATVTTGSSLAGLKVNGTTANLAAGDAINIRGLRADGTVVSLGMVVEPGDTMNTLLGRINDASFGFGGGSRTATATLGSDGRIRLTDDTGGASRLSLSLAVVRADGSSGTLGAVTTAITGRSRQLQSGQDAIIRVDGQEIRRGSNAIIDGITGVNLALQNAEPGTSVDVVVERDVKASVDAVQKLADSYNAIRKFLDEQRLTDAPLYADGSLRRVVDSFTDALRTNVSENGTYSRSVSVGLLLDRNGLLTFNQETFKAALNDKPGEVETLFGRTGLGNAFVTATDSALSFTAGPISTTIRTITENTLVLRKRETDAQRRLDARREQLVARYTRMEEAMGRITSQGNSLQSTVKGLQGNR